ncbi:MAG TPA: ABC transporter substrate-binding protein [Gaiellaceae bacterium]|nr:ABC transporter substrate-binding protein [Gaiellaceae bacterium]
MSDESSGDTPVGGDLSRRELLVRAGAVGAGAVAAGALAGGAKAAPKRKKAAPPRGGKVTWALEQDPAHIAPFGGILTANHWGKAPMYESLIEWDSKLNERPSLATSWKVVNNRTIDFTLRRGVRFHNGKEFTAADAKYSFDLQLNPPAPGSVAVLGQVPAIEGTEVRSRYVLRMRLKNPDARVFGYLAWNRYSAMVPEGMYGQVNAGREGIGTGPFRLLEYQPNSHLEFARFRNYWKRGLPYLDALSFKVLPDEQARVAALRAGAIDGGTFSADSARALGQNRNLKVLRGLTAAFRELQMTIKPGPRKPWHDIRVRQAVNFAINRQEIINRVYSGFGEYSGHVPPGYGPWPLTRAELRNRYEKHDLPKARALMRAAGMANGFTVEMTTFSTPLDFSQVAAVIKAQLDRININVNIVAQEPGTFATNNGRGTFEWDLTARGMRGDVDGYMAEFNPSSTAYQAWYPLYRNQRVWRLVGNGRIQLDQKKRIPMYKEAQRLLMNDVVQIPLVAVSKFQVVRPRVQNMYVAFSDFNTGLHTSVWIKR